jgi:hypothetical protein
VDCKEAPDSAADLRDPGCLAAVLGHLEREFGIESVVLSHYVERQYGPTAMVLLREILAITNLLSQLSTRPPTPNFPGLSRKQVASKCASCPFNPGTLFDGLRSKALRGFKEFHAAFSESTENLYRYREPGCKTCVSATTNDLVYLFRSVAVFGGAAIKASPPEEAPV